MKNVGELMAELGFREDGSDAVKKAFIMNLIRAANASDALRGKAVTPQEFPMPETSVQKQDQLSFDLGPAPSEALHSLESLKRLRALASRKSG